MTPEEIRSQYQKIKNELAMLHQKILGLNLQLQTLQKQCWHPNAKEYNLWGGRDEGKKCPDCGSDF